MTQIPSPPRDEGQFAEKFGKQADFDLPMAKFTSARIGGPADVILTAQSADGLAEMVSLVWDLGSALCDHWRRLEYADQ